MDVVQRSGATFYRMLLTRARTANGTDWSYYDLLFERASKRGITVLPYLLQGEGVYPGPSLYADWGSWVKKVIKRYGSGGAFWSGHPSLPYKPVNTWEVWNEPNMPVNNPGGVLDPEAFARFFVFSSNEIHAAQSGAQVLVGGLYLGGWSEPSMESYVSRMYNVSGMASAVNGFAIHPYAFTAGQQFPEFANEVINIRTVLNRRPLGSSKPLWITELGWPVQYENAVDVTTQADLLRRSFDWVKSVAASYNVQALTWHNARDYPTAKWDFHCGLRDLNGSFRPAWYAFQGETGAPAWPVAVPQLIKKPSAFISPNGTEHVYVTTNGGINHYLKSPGSTWGGEIVAYAPNFTSSPTAFISPNGTENVYVTTNGGINHYLKSPGSTWGGEIAAYGSFTSAPAALTAPDGTEDVYVRTEGGLNRYAKSPGGTWGGEIIANNLP